MSKTFLDYFLTCCGPLGLPFVTVVRAALRGASATNGKTSESDASLFGPEPPSSRKGVTMVGA